MNEKEILEYNKRCAEFLPFKYRNQSKYWIIYKYDDNSFFGKNRRYLAVNNLKFHSDWNWIMEMVEGIEKVADWSLECLNDSDGDRDYQMMIPLSDTNVVLKDKKEAVVDAINQFLIWWEQNKILVLSLYQNDPTRNTRIQ